MFGAILTPQQQYDSHRIAILDEAMNSILREGRRHKHGRRVDANTIPVLGWQGRNVIRHHPATTHMGAVGEPQRVGRDTPQPLYRGGCRMPECELEHINMWRRQNQDRAEIVNRYTDLAHSGVAHPFIVPQMLSRAAIINMAHAHQPDGANPQVADYVRGMIDDYHQQQIEGGRFRPATRQDPNPDDYGENNEWMGHRHDPNIRRV